jgi:hypothetical protein
VIFFCIFDQILIEFTSKQVLAFRPKFDRTNQISPFFPFSAALGFVLNFSKNNQILQAILKNIGLINCFAAYHPTVRRQPQCGVYLLFLFFPSIICRFGECQPPETARIAGLTAR